jgi:hypothetical protein
MINGTHVVVHSEDAEADRTFFRDILGFPWVDAGHGWLIFGLPAAEAAFHPAERNDGHELYLMCDDLKNEMAALRAKGVQCSEVMEARWGSITKIRLPGGGDIGLYQPKHPKP